MAERKICFYYRNASFYRTDIYKVMEEELGVDFYFGKDKGGIRQMSTDSLRRFKGYLPIYKIKSFYWQKGVLGFLRSDYTDLITPGSVKDLSTWVLILFARLFKKRVYFWTHGAYGRESSFRKLSKLWQYKRISGLLLYGNYAKSILTSWGYPSEKMFVIYNSLSYDQQLFERQNLRASDIYFNHFGNNFPTLIFIGRLIQDKQLDRVVEAVYILKQKQKTINCVFVGSGESEDELKQKTKKLGVDDQFWFYGASYDESANANLIYNADICVSPGPIGLTTIHSLMFGTPVITHDDFTHQGPEFEAIEKGVTGDFFHYGDNESLAECISLWLSEHKDRAALREKCFNSIDTHYNPHYQIEVMRSIFKSY